MDNRYPELCSRDAREAVRAEAARDLTTDDDYAAALAAAIAGEAPR